MKNKLTDKFPAIYLATFDGRPQSFYPAMFKGAAGGIVLGFESRRDINNPRKLLVVPNGERLDIIAIDTPKGRRSFGYGGRRFLARYMPTPADKPYYAWLFEEDIVLGPRVL